MDEKMHSTIACCTILHNKINPLVMMNAYHVSFQQDFGALF